MRKRPLYAACTEDTRSEITALDPGPDDVVVAIAAGGGRSLSLLTTSPARVIAVDRAPDQIYNTELKVVSMGDLAYDEFRAFLGLDESALRRDMYRALRPSLSPPARRYWDRRSDLIEAGPLFAGRLERSVSAIARLLRSWGLFRWPEELLEVDCIEEQRNILARHEASLVYLRRYWRVFSNPLVAWLATRDPGFLRSTEGNLGSYQFERFLDYSRRHLLRESYLLQVLYFGRYLPSGPLPIYLTPAGFEAARKSLDRLELHCRSILDLASELRGELASSERTKWSLSDISAWMSRRGFDRFLAQLVLQLRPGDRFCYRNFAAIRPIPSALQPWVRRLSGLCDTLDQQDRSVFFRFEVGEVVKHPNRGLVEGAGLS